VPRLTIATTATAVPMGAQAYQRHVVSRAEGALESLAEPGEQWELRHVVARSLRSPLPGTLRRAVFPAHLQHCKLWLQQARSSARRRGDRLLRVVRIPAFPNR